MKKYWWVISSLAMVVVLVLARRYIIDYAKSLVIPKVVVSDKSRQISINSVDTDKIERVLSETGIFEPEGVVLYSATTAQKGYVTLSNSEGSLV